MPANHTEIEKKLWASADELRANSHLKSSEYSSPSLVSSSCVSPTSALLTSSEN